jgi:hypothetical protein
VLENLLKGFTFSETSPGDLEYEKVDPDCGGFQYFLTEHMTTYSRTLLFLGSLACLWALPICPLTAESMEAPAAPTETASPTPATEQAAPAETPVAAEEPVKTCFECNGAKTVRCKASGCIQGQADCPGPCLKLSTPGWQALTIPGSKPGELYMKYPHDDRSGFKAWSQKHIGEVVVKKNGRASSTRKCDICKGKAKLACAACKETGITTCGMCGGSGEVPESWTVIDNPKLKKRPAHFKLKDGTEIIGQKTIESQDDIMVRTENGTVTIKKSDLVSGSLPPTTP